MSVKTSSLGEMLWILHYVGLCVQIICANMEVDDRVSGNALFTEVPHDIISQAGDDVELKCSFRGAGSSSVSLEIQWWYARRSRERPEKSGWTTKQGLSQKETSNGETKISLVKVVGSNISHRLRLSSIKPSDEGTYECRVIDFSERRAQQHRVQAYLQVQPDDGEHKNKSNKNQPGDDDHRRIRHKIAAAQMRQEMDHQFPNVGLQHHHKVNKTGNKHQSQSRELNTHATHINSDCPDEDCTI